MKKIININFHSRVIPIEETAYEILQQYIESLRRHFANEEGREEIISDIENRFAELFSETLKKGANCITDADVNAIIASMGRPEEFEGEDAAAPAGAAAGSTGSQQQAGAQPNWQYAGEEGRRLYRADNDKILGGVCAGLANYLRLDPAIVRIIFALMTLGWGSGVLLYIILWIVLPTRSLPVNIRKRLYRNSEDKVIGGVASGLAAYFHIDVWIPRLIFALPLIFSILTSIIRTAWWIHWDGPVFFTGGFGGTLFITYIVLWIVLPEAVSASEKLEMRGEKVDLESIKNTIKSDLESFKGRAKEMGSEMQERFQQVGSQVKQNTQTWATEAGPAIRRSGTGFGHAVGVLFKAFFLFIAGIIAFSLIMALIGIAFRGDGLLHLKGYVLEGFWQNFLAWSGFFLFLVIPVVALLTWLIRRISGTRSRSHYLGYSFATLWILGLISVIVLAGMIMNNFRSRQHVEQTVELAQPQHGKLVVRAAKPINRYEDTDWWFDIDLGRNSPFYNLSDDSILLTTVRVKLLRSEDSAYHINLVKISRGSSGNRARELANDIRFHVEQADSTLSLPQGFALARSEKFRNQQVRVEIAVPVGKRILVNSSVDDYHWFNIHPSRRHIRWDDGSDWNFDLDESIDDNDSYPYSTNVEYIMTATGLTRTDRRYNDDENKGSGKERRKAQKNEDNDDQPEYKSEKPQPKTDKEGGGYRYKAPEAPARKADSSGVKRTAMMSRSVEGKLLSALSRV
ncbi:MAG TPA: PspC domain-containing protein [Puia sp.]|jgi:phage shock protein PspC (stress-responsive transcriptional regulator)|nr:PspC domain-containing protein [Puia sp.]